MALDHSCQTQRRPLSERGHDLYETRISSDDPVPVSNAPLQLERPTNDELAGWLRRAEVAALLSREKEQNETPMNRHERRRARKMENKFYTKYVQHLPQVPLDAPRETRTRYHTVVQHGVVCLL
jgi:hypothetical protein